MYFVLNINIRSMFNQNFHNCFKTVPSSFVKSTVPILTTNQQSNKSTNTKRTLNQQNNNKNEIFRFILTKQTSKNKEKKKQFLTFKTNKIEILKQPNSPF